MPAVTVIFPDELLARVDKIVAERKDQKAEPHRSTPAQLHQAHLIAEKDGIAAANRYLRSLRPAQPRSSRMGLVLELVEHGLLALDIENAKSKAAEPAAKKPRRI